MKQKASLELCLKLQDTKTDKHATESIMEFMNTIHKMVSSLAVIICEIARQEIIDKKETV